MGVRGGGGGVESECLEVDLNFMQTKHETTKIQEIKQSTTWRGFPFGDFPRTLSRIASFRIRLSFVLGNYLNNVIKQFTN